ncbi:MAG: hypothetical protein HY558_02955 [Euryarchaeota archaeon]|nr:hypothetical protein [Euryarchaeota archaeon]
MMDPETFKFFERGGEFYLVAYVAEPKAELLRELPPREVLNSDHILLVGPARTMEIDRRLIPGVVSLREQEAAGEFRQALPRDHGAELRTLGHPILGVRIPRATIREANDEDTRALRAHLREKGKLAYEGAVAVLLIADQDHVRLNPFRFWAEMFDERVILGLSREEMARLAGKRLRSRARGWMRRLEFTDASGVPYTLDYGLPGPEPEAVRCLPEGARADSLEWLRQVREGYNISRMIAAVPPGGGSSLQGGVEVRGLGEL